MAQLTESLNTATIAHEKEHKHHQVDGVVLVALLTVALAALDFYSHPGGVADLERRRLLLELIGPITKSLGNFGYSAIGGTMAVLAKHLGLFLSEKFESEKLKKFTNAGFKIAMAMLLIMNPLAESFPNNHEFIPDTSVGLLGVGMAAYSVEGLVKRVKSAFTGNEAASTSVAAAN